MKNILLYPVLVLSIFKCHTNPKPNYGVDFMGAQSAAGIAKQGLDTLSTSIDGAQNTLNKTGEDVSKAIDGASKSLDKAGDKVKETGTEIRNGIIVGTAIVVTYVAIRDAAGYFCPSDEQKKLNLKAEEEHKLLTSKKDLKTCVTKNNKAARGQFGLPTVCEDMARMLISAGGASETDEITKNFKLAYGK